MRSVSTTPASTAATAPSSGVVGHRGSASGVSSSTAAWATTTSPPRRTTVALDGATSTASTSGSAGVAIYDKQLLWKQHGQRKVEHKTLELLGQEDLECTFSPKINRSSSHLHKASLPGAASIATPPVGVVTGRYAALSRDLSGDGCGSECSSSQYSASSPQTIRSMDSEDLRGRKYEHAMAAQARYLNDDCEDEGRPLGATALHPTESQEHSILLHLARQGRAREDAQRAQQKLASTQPRKDFTKTTAARPFELSVTNRKPRRSTSASPTNRSAKARPRTASTVSTPATATANLSNGGSGGSATNSAGPHPFVKRRSQGSQEDTAGNTVPGTSTWVDEENNRMLSAHNDALAQQWQQERATLLATIETQRRELERRERAEEEAVRLAENFATAVQGFEQRLEIVERTTANEMTEMKQLLARQSVATDLILHALGLSNTSTPFAAAQPPPPSSPVIPPSSPVSSLSSSTTTTRRETK